MCSPLPSTMLWNRPNINILKEDRRCCHSFVASDYHTLYTYVDRSHHTYFYFFLDPSLNRAHILKSRLFSIISTGVTTVFPMESHQAGIHRCHRSTTNYTATHDTVVPSAHYRLVVIYNGVKKFYLPLLPIQVVPCLCMALLCG